MSDTRNEQALQSIIGKTIAGIEDLEEGSDRVVIRFTDGSGVRFFHVQGCCENVRLLDFEITTKSIDKLIGGVVNDAREDVREAEWGDDGFNDESGTWAFYNINTSKGCINMRWLGESNGWYGEEVDVDLFVPLEQHTLQ